MNYDNPKKRHWRRTVHNRIVERLGVMNIRPKDATVLYLAGEDDLDRPIALEKGFLAENLIACERDRFVASKLKDRGVLCVQGSIGRVARSGAMDFNVVIADFTSQICKEVLDLLLSLVTSQQFKRCVLAINVLAGRDCTKGSEHWIGQKRGEFLFRCTLAAAAVVCAEMSLPPWVLEYWLSKERCYAADAQNFDSGSYKSDCGQRFDWAVFAIPSIPGMVIDGTGRACKTSDFSFREGRRLNAVKATRTRLLNEKGLPNL